MCGRFVLTLSPEDMQDLFGATLVGQLNSTANYNVCPTQSIPVVAAHEGGRVLTSMRWGFVPHWATSLTDGPLLINARAETLAQKAAFRAAARRRRCLIPSAGFFEWTTDEYGKKLPWYVYQKDNRPMCFAAIWQAWRDADNRRICTVAIVTTTANSDLEAIHHRMPVVVEPQDWPLWLGESGHGAAALMRPSPPGRVDAYRVDPAINKMSASGPELLTRY